MNNHKKLNKDSSLNEIKESKKLVIKKNKDDELERLIQNKVNEILTEKKYYNSYKT